MSKLVTGVALGTSGGTILNAVLTKLNPDEWSAIGVLARIAGIVITGH
ncbi:phage holin [Citrobacter portucalensis]|uniref:Class II holin family protein n=1 Tax=Citrobacter portucalensis TaxID=1639133 RepID=A0AAW5W6W0_9ENTR|nr:phage holin [Citrobacter portucalensis]MCW8351759.1 class II holin family protein [Citrobacter portucalensis]MCX9002994.1 class II holin family protein [Citrobacter portucalensis]MCX9053168.1 class II holin family protein [Citrobacter portucalensis]MCX9059119.1 class II holin family protein [Citrobacter portucalensis]